MQDVIVAKGTKDLGRGKREKGRKRVIWDVFITYRGAASASEGHGATRETRCFWEDSGEVSYSLGSWSGH